MLKKVEITNLKNDIGNSNISILSYIEKNTILDENTINDTFIIFKKFQKF